MKILNKYDRILIVVLIGLTLFSMYYIRIINPQANELIAIVMYDKKEVLRIDLNNIEGTKQYAVKGEQGEIVIEAKRGSVRVLKENSPYHLCSIQGWSNSTAMPIVCLPNKVVIKFISSDQSNVDSIIN